MHVGEHVRRGQVIGKLGNSGNTSAPHLDIHRVVRVRVEGVPARGARDRTERVTYCRVVKAAHHPLPCWRSGALPGLPWQGGGHRCAA